MKLLTILGTALATLTLAGTAQASLLINSIDLLMVDTTYNARSPFLSAGLSNEDAAIEALTNGILVPSANPDNIICMESLGALEGITAHGTCGSDKYNIGSLYVVSGTATGPAELEFGMDWGRGGFTFLLLDGLLPTFTRLDGDTWWNNNWNHGDVFGLSITQPGDFLLGLVGFEGCCDGSNSVRWRSASRARTAVGGEWQTLAVNSAEVPVPGTALLYAIGLMGLALVRRRAR